MQPLAIWLICVCRPTPCMVASNCVPRRLGLCWSRTLGLLPVSAASPSMDHEHGTVCHLDVEHQIRPCALSSVISRPTCFSSSLRCCWQLGSAPFVRRRCDCLANSATTINVQTCLLTYLHPAGTHCPAGTMLRFLVVITGKLQWQHAGIKFSCVSGQNQHFRPCRKNHTLDRKMIPTF